MADDMADDVLQQQTAPARQRVALAVISVAILALASGAAVLWAHYGTTVFFQTIAAGLAACF